MTGYHPLRELTIARTKEFFREPEAIFWVYVFPILLMIGLGIAFRSGGQGELRIAVTRAPDFSKLVEAMESEEAARPSERTLVFQVHPRDRALSLYAAGKVDLVVDLTEDGYEFIYDPSRMGAEAARLRVGDVLQRLAGRTDPIASKDVRITEPGSRYIDWLIPGLMGLNLVGGGLWGLGFVTVDLRMRKLLKRFVATPMRRSDFLLALVVSRLLFLATEMVLILLAGHVIFGLSVKGSFLSVAFVCLLGGFCFSGLGLLLACRADRIEVISGLINVVMLPMWLLAGTFFSADRFPLSMQPIVQALPLTHLNNALRAVILEGAPIQSQWLPILVLVGVGAASFALALRWFRWQ